VSSLFPECPVVASVDGGDLSIFVSSFHHYSTNGTVVVERKRGLRKIRLEEEVSVVSEDSGGRRGGLGNIMSVNS